MLNRRGFFRAFVGASATTAPAKPRQQHFGLGGQGFCGICGFAVKQWGVYGDPFIACSNPSCPEYERPYELPTFAAIPVTDHHRVETIKAGVREAEEQGRQWRKENGYKW